MIEAVIRWSVQHRILVLLAAVTLTLSGLYAVKHTPIDAIPDLSDVQVIVKTSYPGQSPQVIEERKKNQTKQQPLVCNAQITNII